MRRFIIFPIFWSGLFVASWVFVAFWGTASVGLTFRFLEQPIDTYSHVPEPGLDLFAQTLIAGCVFGFVFAVVDFVSNRHDPHGSETLKRLIKHGFQSLRIVLPLVVVCSFIFQVASARFQANNRYHAFPPDSLLLNILPFVPLTLLIGTFLWMAGKLLWPRQNISKTLS